MFTVALIGPDGAGKTTISRRLNGLLPIPVKYLYMGVNLDASNHMLPTTRMLHLFKRLLRAGPDAGGPPDPDLVHARPDKKLTLAGVVKRAAGGLKSGVSLVNRVCEEWFRQGVAWYYQRRGHVVLFDRHFFPDYYAYDIANTGQKRALGRRLHGLMLARFYPKPDLVIYLDAPAEVLLARKGEGTLRTLESRRQGYLQMRDVVPHFVVVDASQPEDVVARQVSRVIENFHTAMSGGAGRG